MKYRFYEAQNTSLAVMGGLNISTINKFDIEQLGLGLILSHDFTQNLSLDANLTFASSPNFNNYSVSALSDIGCYFGYFQPILELGYQFSSTGKSTLISALGFTLEPAKNYLLVITVPYTYNVLNKSALVGANIAITITIE